MKKNAKFESIFHFDRLFTKLKIITMNGSLRDCLAITARESIDACVDVILMRETQHAPNSD